MSIPFPFEGKSTLI